MRLSRRCGRVVSTALSVLLSASLIMGSVPTAALAEMTEGDGVPELVVDETVLPAEDSPMVEETLLPETEMAEAPAYDEVPESEPENVADAAETDEAVGTFDAAAASDAALADDIDPVVLTIPEERDQGEAISLAAGETWVGEFVAPEDWTYVFGFVSNGPGGNGTPDVTIYKDRALTQELASQTASTDSLQLDLSEGEAVYVVVKETEGAELSRTFAVTYDHDMTTTYPGIRWRYLYDGNPHRPTDVWFLSDIYTEGTYFVLSCFRDAAGNESLDPPTEVGVYTVVYRWIGDYRGFVTAKLEIVAPGDLADTTLCWADGTSVAARNTVFSTGNPTYEIVVKDLEGNRLESGTDYDLVYYTEVYHPGSGPGEPGETERTEYPSAPTEPGTYKIYAKPAAGSSYSGQTEADAFTIIEVDPISDVSFGNLYQGTLSSEQGIACYSLTLPSGGRLDADISTEGEDVAIQFYGTNGQNASSGLNGYLPKGTYYVIASGEGSHMPWEDPAITSGDGEYSFTLSFTSAAESFPRELGDPDDTVATANPISINTAYRGFMSLRDQTDFYRFSLSKNSDLTLSVDAKCDTFNTRSIPLDFTVYDTTGEMVWLGNTYSSSGSYGVFIDISNGGRGSCTLTLESGDYILRVRRPSDAPWVYGAYEFSFTGDEAKSLADATIAPIPDQTFTGKAIEPAVTVKLGDTTLVRGKDYEVSYENNTSAGTARVKITGIGSYVGSVSASFNIIRHEDLIASGAWGTCPWEIAEDGTLTVHPGKGASQSDASEKSPWDAYAANITSIVFSGEGGQKVVAPEDCSYLLAGLSKAKTVDVSGLDTSDVTTMDFMFNKCSGLTAVDLSSLDTSSVTSMWFMFLDCSSMTSADLHGWNTKNVYNLRGLFQRCRALAKVDVSGWDTQNVNDLSYMFLLCSSLASVDLTSFNTMSVYSMNNMFEGCSKLNTIYVSKGWTTLGVIDAESMFSGCQALVGGNGTAFSTEHTNAEYARIDAAGKPGYLTLGSAPAASFNDVSAKTPHAGDITWLADAGISTGWKKSDGTVEFRPTNTVIRQDMAAFLFRLAKSWGLVGDDWQPSGSVTFTDVTPKTPHYREIMWLAESGISAGWKVGSGREFRPRNTVVRQDMAAFLRRLQALRDPSVKDWKPTGASPFRDVTASTPHSEDILWLAESGVSAGWRVGGTKEFRPTNTVIRQDMAAFLHRLDNLG